MSRLDKLAMATTRELDAHPPCQPPRAATTWARGPKVRASGRASDRTGGAHWVGTPMNKSQEKRGTTSAHVATPRSPAARIRSRSHPGHRAGQVQCSAVVYIRVRWRTGPVGAGWACSLHVGTRRVPPFGWQRPSQPPATQRRVAVVQVASGDPALVFNAKYHAFGCGGRVGDQRPRAPRGVVPASADHG